MNEEDKSKCPVSDCGWFGAKALMVGGVCPKCADAFRKKHISHLESKQGPDTAHNPAQPIADDVAYVLDHLEPSSDFDWESVSPDGLSDVETEIRRQCALALAKFSRRLLELGGRNRNQFFIAANCFAFAAHIHPDQERSGEEIAKKLKIGKAAFFKRVNTCRDILKLPRIAGARSDSARKTFKRTAKRHHEKTKQNHKIKTLGNFLGRLDDAH
jgi:hypothetical protein